MNSPGLSIPGYFAYSVKIKELAWDETDTSEKTGTTRT